MRHHRNPLVDPFTRNPLTRIPSLESHHSNQKLAADSVIVLTEATLSGLVDVCGAFHEVSTSLDAIAAFPDTERDEHAFSQKVHNTINSDVFKVGGVGRR